MKENLSVMDFIDKDIGDVEPVKPPSLECTPYKLVEEVRDLKELAAKLRGENEFAVKFDYSILCFIGIVMLTNCTSVTFFWWLDCVLKF